MRMGPRDPRGSQPDSPHERARELAAERLSLPLPAAEQVWLDGHLRICRPCAAVAAAYAADREALRRLVAPEPPRDLWARTATGLDATERDMAHRKVAGPPAPGFRRLRQGTAPRTIRSIRAERHASAIRSAGFRASMRRSSGRAGVADRPRTPGWLLPFGGLAALAVTIVVGGTALLAQGFNPSAPLIPPGSTTAALGNSSLQPATPIPVGAADVSWLSPGENGSYTWNSAHVDEVCPPVASPDCAPIDGSQSSQLTNLGSRPRTVLRSPSKAQLVVVDAGTRNGGQAMYVMAVPSASPATPEASGAVPPGGPGGSPSPSAPVTASVPAGTRPSVLVAPTLEPTPSPTPVPTLVTTPVPTPTELPAPSSTPTGAPGSAAPAPSTGSSSPAASLSPTPSGATPMPTPIASGAPIAPGTPEPTAAAMLSIISGVVVVGETAAYSPDGTMLAFSARPADGSHGPDIYLWHTGDPSAQPVTFDHESTFSGWWGTTLIGSRAVPVAADTNLTPGASGPDSASSPAGTSSSGGGLNPNGGARPSPSASSQGFTTNRGPDASSSAPVLSPFGASFTTGMDRQLSQLFGLGGLSFGGNVYPAASSVTGTGVAPAVPGATGSPDGSGAVPTASAPVPGPSGTDASTQAIAESFLIDTTTGLETQITTMSAWRPVVDPTGRIAVYWNGTLRYDPTTASWVPDRGQLFLASWPALTGSDPTAPLAPSPLLAGDPDGAPSGDWDIRWDATGQHLAIWVADSADPNLGRLSLLTVDPATGATSPNGLLLHDAPAQPGFSLGSDRLAWATPPGQDGEGSRLQILAWTGANAGKIDSQPASGPGAVIVVR